MRDYVKSVSVKELLKFKDKYEKSEWRSITILYKWTPETINQFKEYINWSWFQNWDLVNEDVFDWIVENKIELDWYDISREYNFTRRQIELYQDKIKFKTLIENKCFNIDKIKENIDFINPYFLITSEKWENKLSKDFVLSLKDDIFLHLLEQHQSHLVEIIE